MKPETALFLEKSHELLERADTMMGVGLTDDAGRAAYLAGLHAAQAFIFDTTGRVFKRHSGVQREFSRLVKDDPSDGLAVNGTSRSLICKGAC